MDISHGTLLLVMVYYIVVPRLRFFKMYPLLTNKKSLFSIMESL